VQPISRGAAAVDFNSGTAAVALDFSLPTSYLLFVALEEGVACGAASRDTARGGLFSPRSKSGARKRKELSLERCEVAIVGAGPYGLSVAAHLGASPVSPHIRVFGEPMSFWRQNMPTGMWLRSPWSASNLSDPDRELTLDAYERARGVPIRRPIPLEDFIDYGRWFQAQAAVEVDSRNVRRVESENGGFNLLLDDGDRVSADLVTVAAGIGAFAARPPRLAEFPSALVSHSSDHGDLTRFKNHRVAVVGGGQSAIETAVLLNEAGANVEVLARGSEIRWLGRSASLHRFAGRLLYAPSDVGPAGVSWIVAEPWAFRKIPRPIQDPLAERCIRPAASGWLLPRIEGVRITTATTIESARTNNSHVELGLSDGTKREVDHVLLATGFAVDIKRYGFLGESLLAQIDRVNGSPRLSRAFESSVPGLYFVGAPASWSFGPLARFVAGADYAARAVSRSVVRRVGRSR
jgi:thioredoxin reductase